MIEDIAIIGMAGRFPDAANLDELVENLKAGRDSVREISQERLKNTTLPPERKYKICGYLEDVDKFDYKLFNIPRGEAETMAPALRLLLEIAYLTIENSACSFEALSGSNASVFVSLLESDYYMHADEFMETLVSGNVNEYFAPRISRQFNLRGNAVMINASCASSLVAVDMACSELRSGNADFVLVCAVNLDLFPYVRDVGLGLDSPDGKSKAFSAHADGMSFGETAVGLLLRPLDRAVKEEDIIHAVIKSSAVNNNADRSASPTAPDSLMQAEVIKKAWEKAGIHPTDIGYIEAHGSGTQLGDSLEIEGLNLAFREYTDRYKICPISTIKSNVGHGRPASGLSGLVKAVLSLKHKILFPNIYFEVPNPVIDFEHSAIYVNKDLRSWDRKDGKLRIAGVTSIGANGVNCHVVLQEAPPGPDQCQNPKELRDHVLAHKNYFFTLSSKTPEGLKENLTQLLLELKGSDNCFLRDISYTLNIGRKHYEYRFACNTGSLEELKRELAAAAAAPDNNGNTNIDKKNCRPLKKLIFIFSDHREIPGAAVHHFSLNHEIFSRHYNQCTGLCEPNDTDTLTFRDFAFQYAFYKLLNAYGIQAGKILGTGIGKILYDVASDQKTLSAGLSEIRGWQSSGNSNEEIQNLEERVDALLKREVAGGPAAFIEMGGGSVLSHKLEERKRPHRNEWFVLTLPFPGKNAPDPLSELFKSLYLAGYNFDWNSFYRHHQGRRIELPGYCFEKTRVWLRDEPKTVYTAPGSPSPERLGVELEEGSGETTRIVARFWQEVLKKDSFSLDDDFFEVGGDSLKATEIIVGINKEMGLTLSFEDMFDFPTIRALSEYIDSFWSTEQKVSAAWKEVLKVDALDPEDNFFDLGGHSLLANQVLNRIKKQFGLELNFEDFFQHPTVGSFSRCIDRLLSDKKNKVEYKAIESIEKKSHYKLSPAQKRMFILHNAAPSSLYYNTPVDFILEGEINKDRLESAFKAMVRRHEILRTSFALLQEEPAQRVHESVDFAIEYIEIPGASPEEPEAEPGKGDRELQENLIRPFIRPFDLLEAPLMRVLLVKTARNRYIFVLDMHHIIIDGFSFRNVFIPELTALYNEEMLPELSIQYKDFSHWQNNLIVSGEIGRQEEYWLQEFSGEIPTLNLPVDYPRPAKQRFTGDSIDFRLSREETEKLKEHALKSDVTLFMAVLTGLNIFLAKISGQDDIVVGTPTAGRRHADVEKMIGLFVNVLAQRNYPSGEKTVKEFLMELKKRTLASYENQDYQFEDLVEQISQNRDAGRSPLFDVMLLQQNFQVSSPGIPGEGQPGLKVNPYSYENKTSRYDLLVFCADTGDHIAFTFEYNTTLFKKETVEGFIEDFRSIMAPMNRDETIKIKDIELANRPVKGEALYRDLEFRLQS